MFFVYCCLLISCERPNQNIKNATIPTRNEAAACLFVQRESDHSYKLYLKGNIADSDFYITKMHDERTEVLDDYNNPQESIYPANGIMKLQSKETENKIVFFIHSLRFAQSIVVLKKVVDDTCIRLIPKRRITVNFESPVRELAFNFLEIHGVVDNENKEVKRSLNPHNPQSEFEYLHLDRKMSLRDKWFEDVFYLYPEEKYHYRIEFYKDGIVRSDGFLLKFGERDTVLVLKAPLPSPANAR